MTGRLENWEAVKHHSGAVIVWGNLYDDVRGRWREGQWIHTSSVKTPVEVMKEGVIIETLNSTYLLGKPRQ